MHWDRDGALAAGIYRKYDYVCVYLWFIGAYLVLAIAVDEEREEQDDEHAARLDRNGDRP